MSITDLENTYILRYLQLPPSYLPSLLNQHSNNYSFQGDAYITEVKDAVSKIKAIDDAYDLAASDSGSGLIAADTLRWATINEGGKFSNMLNRRSELIKRLNTLVSLVKPSNHSPKIYRG